MTPGKTHFPPWLSLNSQAWGPVRPSKRELALCASHFRKKQGPALPWGEDRDSATWESVVSSHVYWKHVSLGKLEFSEPPFYWTLFRSSCRMASKHSEDSLQALRLTVLSNAFVMQISSICLKLPESRPKSKWLPRVDCGESLRLRCWQYMKFTVVTKSTYKEGFDQLAQDTTTQTTNSCIYKKENLSHLGQILSAAKPHRSAPWANKSCRSQLPQRKSM